MGGHQRLPRALANRPPLAAPAPAAVAETNHTNLEAAQHQRVTALNRDSIKIRGALRNALATIGAATTACAEHITDTNVAAPAVPAAVGVGVAGR